MDPAVAYEPAVGAAYEPAVGVGELAPVVGAGELAPVVGAGDLRQLDFLARLRARRRFRAAAYFAAWGIGGIFSTTVPGLAANPDHVLLYYMFLMLAIVLLLLAVAAPDLPVADRAAARVEEYIRTLFYREARA